MISYVLKATEVFEQSGNFDALESDLGAGDACMAPWSDAMYPAKIIAISSKHTIDTCKKMLMELNAIGQFSLAHHSIHIYILLRFV